MPALSTAYCFVPTALVRSIALQATGACASKFIWPTHLYMRGPGQGTGSLEVNAGIIDSPIFSRGTFWSLLYTTIY
jgi:hypothetical protein